MDVTEEYQLKQIGIYASFGTEEILFIVGQDKTGERVPAISDREIEYDYQISFAFDTASEIKISVSANDFIKKVDALNLLNSKVDKADFESRISEIKRHIVINLQEDKWTGSGPWTQRINIDWVKSADRPEVSHYLLDGVTDASTIKGAWKAYSCIDRVDTYDGYAIVSCFRKKPIQGIFIIVRGG